MPAQPTYARVPATLERWLGSTIRVLVAGSHTVVVLDGVGAMAWAGLAHPGTVDDLVDAMTSVATPAGGQREAHALVLDALDRLVDAGLLVDVSLPTDPAAPGPADAPATPDDPAAPEPADPSGSS